MYNKTITSFLTAMIIPLAAYAAPDKKTAVFLNDFSESLKEVKTMVSQFEQKRQMELLAVPLISKGAIIVENPGKIRWETTEPYKSILIANDGTVAQFEWVNEKRKKLKTGYEEAMKQVMDSLSMIWSGKLADQQKDYELSVKTTGKHSTLVMTPRNSDMRSFISSIDIHFNKDITAAKNVVMKEPNGDSTTITFLTQQINVDLPQKCFDLDSPVPVNEIIGD